MIIDFQQHYTPAEMLKGAPKIADRPGRRARQPEHLLTRQLGDLKHTSG